MFPEHAFGDRLYMSAAAAARHPGSEAHPLRYDMFAFLFRPMLHEACKRSDFMYQKIAPTAVLFERGRSPFKARRGSLKVEEFIMCNIFASSLDTWKMKEVNFMDAYRPVDKSCYAMLEEGIREDHADLRDWWRSTSVLTQDDRDDGEGLTPHDYMCGARPGARGAKGLGKLRLRRRVPRCCPRTACPARAACAGLFSERQNSPHPACSLSVSRVRRADFDQQGMIDWTDAIKKMKQLSQDHGPNTARAPLGFGRAAGPAAVHWQPQLGTMRSRFGCRTRSVTSSLPLVRCGASPCPTTVL